MIKVRTPVYVGTSDKPNDEEIVASVAASLELWDKGFLPIQPFMYIESLPASEDDIRSLRMQLLAGVRNAVFVGTPTEYEASIMMKRSVNVKYAFKGGTEANADPSN